MKTNKRLGITLAIIALFQLQAYADVSVSSWEELGNAANNETSNSTIEITSNLDADGNSIGFIQPQLTLKFNGIR